MRALLLFICLSTSVVAASTVTTKNYTIEQKEEFTTALNRELRDLDQDIARMKAKIRSTSADANTRLNKQLAELEEDRIKLNQKMDRLSTASKSAWGEVRKGVQSAYKELKSSFNRASDEFDRKL